MASCGFAHLSGDRVDQVQTIWQMSSVWLWEAVQRVLKATFEMFGIWRLCLRLWIEESPTSHIYERQPSWARHCRPLGNVPHRTKLVSRKTFCEELIQQRDRFVGESFFEVNYSFSYKTLLRAYIEGKDD